MAIAILLSAMQSCLAEESQVEHASSLSSLVSGASDASLRNMEIKVLSDHSWWRAASVWWGKHRSGFRKGFYTGLCIAWVVGGSGLVLAVLGGFYTLAANFSWHAKVKGGPMLPLHRLGCA
jgi:hypothetical protein